MIVKDYQQEAKSHRDKLAQNHRVRKRIDDMQGIAAKLVSVGGFLWWRLFGRGGSTRQ